MAMSKVTLGNLETKLLPSYYRMACDEQQAFDEMSSSLRRKLRLITEHAQGKRLQTGTLTGAFSTFGNTVAPGPSDAKAASAAQNSSTTSATATGQFKIPVESLDLDCVSAIACVEEAEQRSRPRTASYTANKCRPTRPGSGGSPRTPQRPKSAPAHRVKTERWRETGAVRWPVPAMVPAPQMPEEKDRMPFRLLLPHAPNTPWQEALWARSLRCHTVQLEDQIFANFGPYGLRELHEDARKLAASGVSSSQQPFGGATTGSRLAVRQSADMKDWVERPVSTGKLAQDHKYGGQRYVFNETPRKISEVPKETLARNAFSPCTGFEI
mmetsp:Transcript_73393/g.174877  ORF Transcript_73393/g.174877 Transcript_73393/m.174877 type:complete len:326 (+) Transcript_73393:117-1094(+)